MDIEMPHMNGIEATVEIMNILRNTPYLNESENELRVNPEELNNCTIVFQTSNYSVQSERACLDAGAKRVLTKPIKKEELEEVLNQYYFIE